MNEDMKDQFEHALAVQLNRRKELKAENVGRLFSRKAVEQSFLECFELIGGVPRLAIWANDPENYGEFLKLLSKLLPKEVSEKGGQVINFVSSIPDSELNNPRPDAMTLEHDDDPEQAD